MKRSLATVSLTAALILSSAAVVQAAPTRLMGAAASAMVVDSDPQSGALSTGVRQLLSAIDRQDLLEPAADTELEDPHTESDETPMSGSGQSGDEGVVPALDNNPDQVQSGPEATASTLAGVGPFADGATCQVPSDIVLDKHWGPAPNQPYEGTYQGTNRSKNIIIDPNKLYAATTTIHGRPNRPVAELSTTSATGTFNGTPATIGNMSGPNYWSADGAEMTTMAMDGGANGARVGKSYLWSWAEASLTWYPSLVSSVPPAGAIRDNSISIAEVLNNTDGALTNNEHPNRILFVPKPTSADWRYWSGGEVDQRTGYLYLTSGEDSTMGNNFRMMIFDPVTGNYAESGVLQPKTPTDRTMFHGRYPASDMAIDGKGDAYVLMSDVPTINPGSGYTQATTWLAKVEYRQGGGWVYSGVMPLWHKSGSTYNRISGSSIWGMAFFEGKLYFSGGYQEGGNGGVNYAFGADPLTGITTQIPGATGDGIFDLASAQTTSVLNGTVFNDLNRNGIRDSGETGVADQVIQLYTSSGTVVGQQSTNSSGEYSFLVPPPATDTTYYARLVQPRVLVGTTTVNAAQTGITSSNLCGIDSVQVQSYGELVEEAAPPLPTDDGSYIDYPEQMLGATDGSQTISPDQMLLAAVYHVQAGSNDVTTVNFGVNADGSWGDAGFRSLASQQGPRHINPGIVGENPFIYLGEAPGWYSNGSNDNSHTDTDDGVKVLWKKDPADPDTWERVEPEQWIYAVGNNYQFDVDVRGTRAENATVRAWIQTRNTNNFPSTVMGTIIGGSGEITLHVPATPALSTPQHYLRVNATSTTNQLDTFPFNGQPNLAGPYAPARGTEPSRTSDWVIDGEVEDYRLTLAVAALRLFVEGAPGDYGFTLTNVTSTGPSSTSSTGTVPTDGSLSYISSHAITNVSVITNITVSLPPGVRVVGPAELLDIAGNVVGEISYNKNTNQLSIPSSVWTSSRDLTLRLATEVELKAQATKEVAGNEYGTAHTPVTPAHFEIVATDTQGQEVVLNGEGAVVLARDEVYTISERMVPGAPDAAKFYLDAGLTCTDGAGSELPSGMFDPDARTITPDRVTPTVRCTWRNQAAEATLLPARIGEANVGTGWQLQLQAADAGFDANLTESAANRLIRPGKYDLSVGSVPTETQVAGMERLNLADPTCAPLAETLTNIPPDCWLPLSGTGLSDLTLAAGTHEVFRLVAVAGDDLPALPLTGGLGAWVFAVLGGGGLLTAGALSGYRRWRIASAGTSAPQSSRRQM